MQMATDDEIITEINKLREKFVAKGIELEVSEDALDWLTKIGFDVQYGARPLKRAIQKYIANPLAMKLLETEFVSGDMIKIDEKNGEFVFDKA